MPLPPLRNVDVSSLEHEGRTVVCLRDPEGYVDAQLVLTPEAFFIAAQLDGTADVRDIQYTCAKQFGGQIIPSEDILRVVNCLDEQGFLVSERFEAIRKEIDRTFAESEVRLPALAGKTYPDNPDELRTFLDQLFTKEGGPGRTPEKTHGTGAPPKCLVVPHIDFDRGAAAYAHGYLHMADAVPPDVALIFGVAHSSGAVPFILTKKSFGTPFGTLETDQDVVAKLESVCQWPPYESESVHRSEHSIEFQALMLAYLFGTKVRIVPILCAAFSDEPDKWDTPADDPHIRAFLDTCRDVVAQHVARVVVIAAADLAHVGRRFGDDFDIDARVVARVEARDREDLARVAAMDAEGFYRSVMKDHNARQVCGLYCIYSALRSVDGAAERGQLLHYGYAPDPAGGIVSFASLVLS